MKKRNFKKIINTILFTLFLSSCTFNVYSPRTEEQEPDNKKYVTISFALNKGDTPSNSRKFQKGYKLHLKDLPNISINNDSLFLGWFLNEKLVEEGYIVNENIVLYGKWLNKESKPIKLNPGTDGTYGTEALYLNFGDWPQTLKAENVQITQNKKNIHGWDCFQGSDGNFYVFENNQYFKLEPIKWRILTSDYKNADGTKGIFLLSEQGIDSRYFYKDLNNRTIDGETIYPVNYQYSDTRAYLNGLNGTAYGVGDYSNGNSFINKAFSKDSILIIKDTKVDNSTRADFCVEETVTGTNFKGNDTIDKIFLPSAYELSIKEYLFNNGALDDIKRMKPSTDYMKITKNNTKGQWWTRSALYQDKVRDVYGNGRIFDDHAFPVNSEGFLIVPAMVISANAVK